MNKYVKWTLIIVISLGALLMIVGQLGRMYTKSHSPEETVLYEKGELKISVTYSRPYKKDREIFGGLVPFGEVWRTGANEATEFSTNQDLLVEGQKLPAGDYTLWTIPGKVTWKVIFNSKEYDWGVRISDGKASRDPEFDKITVEVPVQFVPEPNEQFKISIDPQAGLQLTWDQTAVNVDLGL